MPSAKSANAKFPAKGRSALAACLVFLESNGLLLDPKLPTDQWEEFVLAVAASKIDRDETTQRLRKLVKPPRKR